MKPFVAVTTAIEPQGGDYQKPMIGLYVNYVAPLEKAGLTPILITPAHSEESIRALVAQCSGMVLTGGEDIDPKRYGHDPIPELGMVSPSRDQAEFTALDEAVRHGFPILGICRGHQLLNVFFGGTLCQDIEVAMEDAKSHHQTSPWGAHHHSVTIEAGTRLMKAIDCEEIQINSYHHQAVQKLGDGLIITARSEDGLVEGIESTDNTWIVGVQWHPERHDAQAKDSDPNVRLFAAFADAVGAEVGAAARR